MRVFGRLPLFGRNDCGGLSTGQLALLTAADPPAVRFLEALRERQYYDVALDYLEAMRQSDRCPAELKETIDYQIGMTLLDAANAIEAPPSAKRSLTKRLWRRRSFSKGHRLTNWRFRPAPESAVLSARRDPAHAAGQPGSLPPRSQALAERRKFYDERGRRFRLLRISRTRRPKSWKERAGREPSSRVKSELTERISKCSRPGCCWRTLRISKPDQSGRQGVQRAACRGGQAVRNWPRNMPTWSAALAADV